MIVGLIGPARCGKSTVAKHMVENYKFTEHSFAAPLKDMVMKALIANPPPYPEVLQPKPYTPEDWKRLIYDKRNPFTRWLLQWVGTDIFRDQVAQNFWVERAAEALRSESKNIVFADVRFVNEANVIQFVGGEIWEIKRPNMSYTDGIEHGAGHSSEQEMKKIVSDRTMVADEGIHHLHAITEAIMNDIMIEQVKNTTLPESTDDN